MFKDRKIRFNELLKYVLSKLNFLLPIVGLDHRKALTIAFLTQNETASMVS